jgi:hypothetical protein
LHGQLTGPEQLDSLVFLTKLHSSMETIDEDEQELHAELDLLTRASARISEILPR